METIKRYENRKLYSTSLNKYVKLSYITDLIRTKQKFIVINNKDKSDITKNVLKKAILEEVDLPLETLTQLVRGN